METDPLCSVDRLDNLSGNLCTALNQLSFEHDCRKDEPIVAAPVKQR